MFLKFSEAEPCIFMFGLRNSWIILGIFIQKFLVIEKEFIYLC